jgi:hypothetical protein
MFLSTLTSECLACMHAQSLRYTQDRDKRHTQTAGIQKAKARTTKDNQHNRPPHKHTQCTRHTEVSRWGVCSPTVQMCRHCDSCQGGVWGGRRLLVGRSARWPSIGLSCCAKLCSSCRLREILSPDCGCNPTSAAAPILFPVPA